MTDAAPANPVLLLLALLPIATALFLLRRARRRRAGDTRHCRNCDYLLYADTSTACPECGQRLTPQSIVRGRLAPSRPATATALMLLALTAIALMFTAPPIVRKYDWYRLRPTGWLIDDMASRDATRARRACSEFQRRDRDHPLADADHQRLTRLALEQQATSRPTTPILPDLLEYLGNRCLNGKLSPAETDQFFTNGLGADLRVRPRVLAGDRFPIEFRPDPRGPLVGWWTRVVGETVSVGDKVELLWTDMLTTGSTTTGFTLSHDTQRPTGRLPGVYPITVAQTARIYHGPWGDTQKSRLLREVVVSRTATLNVVARLPPEAEVKLIDRPDLRSGMQAAVRVDRCSVSNRSDHDLLALVQITLSFTAPPENIAADVFFRIDGRTYPAGSASVVKGTTVAYLLQAERVPIRPTIDVILRPSTKVARETPDLFQIWNGEIVVPNVGTQTK